MLETLEVTGSQYDRLFQLAREAAQKGWWDKYGVSMGPRQKLYADLEYNADNVREYNQTVMPAVLQAPEFISALVDLDECQGKLDYVPERMTEARMRRQSELLRPGGPSYETILDECMIHRLAVPPQAKIAQLRHMIGVVSDEERITVRVLRHDAIVPGGFLLKSAFYLYTFAEPGDSPIAVIDTATTDLVLPQRSEVARYAAIYDPLREAALSREDSIAFLDRVANYMTYATFWKLVNKNPTEREVDPAKANPLLALFAVTHPHTRSPPAAPFRPCPCAPGILAREPARLSRRDEDPADAPNPARSQ